MTRSKFSTKAVVLATAIGLSTVAFAGSQPAAAQSYTCPADFAYDPSYGCTLGGDYGYYGYPNVLYGRHPDHGAFDHGFGHGMGAGGSIVDHGMGFHHSIIGVGHFGGGGFGHGMGMGIAGGHNIGGGFGHGMAGGFGHGGGGGHR
jgi:hypothetical protein